MVTCPTVLCFLPFNQPRQFNRRISLEDHSQRTEVPLKVSLLAFKLCREFATSGFKPGPKQGSISGEANLLADY